MSNNLAFEFVATYSASTATLYEAQREDDAAWSGYILLNITVAPLKISFTDSLSSYDGSYLFASSRPAELNTDPKSFIQSVSEYINQQISAARIIVWLKTIDPVSFCSASQYSIGFGVSSGKYTTRTDWNAALGENFAFFILNTTQIIIDDDNGMMKFQAVTSSAPKIGFNLNGSDLGISITGETNLIYAWIPFVGDNTGCTIFNASLESIKTFNTTTTPSGLPTGFVYTSKTATDDSASDQQFFYPAFTIDDLPSNLICVGTIDPLDPYNQFLPQCALLNGVLRSGFAITDTPNLPSALRNELGNQISLLPLGASATLPPLIGLQAGSLALTSSSPTSYAPSASTPGLSLSGRFGMNVADVAAGQSAQMLCGIYGSERIGFTNWNADADSNDLLLYVTAQAAYAQAFPYDTATLNLPDSGEVQTPLTGEYNSAWMTVLQGADKAPFYQAEPAGCPMYGFQDSASDDDDDEIILLQSAPISTQLPQGASHAFPLVPYASFDSSVSADTLASFESTILAATRQGVISSAAVSTWQKRNQARHARHLSREQLTSEDATDYRTTPQGAIATVDPDSGAMLSIMLGQTLDENGVENPFGFELPDQALQNAFQINQLFLVAVNKENLCTGSSEFLNTLDIAGWSMSAAVGNGVSATDYSNVMVVKYCDGSFKDRIQNPNNWSSQAGFSLPAGTDSSAASLSYTGLSEWLQELVADAESQVADNPDSPYANFVELINDPDWKGVLVLKADLDASSLPEGLQGIVAGIDMSQFVAHHFGFTASQVTVNADNSITFDGNSSTFGLVDYINPTYAANLKAGLSPDTPITLYGNDNYAFSVLQLQVLFDNAVILSFQSHIELAVSRILESDVTSTTFGGNVMPSNGVVLDGSYIDQNGTGVYIFEQSVPSIFSLDSNLLTAVTFSRIQYNYMGAIDDGTTALNRFTIMGHFDFAVLNASNGSVFDVLSFGSSSSDDVTGSGLNFSNLLINMTYPVTTPNSVTFIEDTGNLAYDLSNSRVRDSSLFKGFGLQLDGFITATSEQQPADFGFLTVSNDLNLTALDGPWFGVTYSVTMGGPGALASAAGFSSTLLLAWAANTTTDDDNYALFVGLSLPGAAPGAKLISLEGVFKVSVGSITLMYQQVPEDPSSHYYCLRLNNIGIKILGIAKLPPNANIQFFLFGDPDSTGSLGWYAAYQDNDDTSQKQTRLALPDPINRDNDND
jgi:hypothetical protein